MSTFPRSCHSHEYFYGAGCPRRQRVRQGQRGVMPWHVVAYDGPEEDSPLVPGFDPPVRASEIEKLRHRLAGGPPPRVNCQSLPIDELLAIYAGCTIENRVTGERIIVPRTGR